MTRLNRDYDTWSDNDDDDIVPVIAYREQPLTAQDFCAIATVAVRAGLIPETHAQGVARTLLRTYRQSPTFRDDPNDVTPIHMAYRPVIYDANRLRAAAITLSAACHGHEDPTIQSQQVLAAVLAATR